MRFQPGYQQLPVLSQPSLMLSSILAQAKSRRSRIRMSTFTLLTQYEARDIETRRRLSSLFVSVLTPNVNNPTGRGTLVINIQSLGSLRNFSQLYRQMVAAGFARWSLFSNSDP